MNGSLTGLHDGNLFVWVRCGGAGNLKHAGEWSSRPWIWERWYLASCYKSNDCNKICCLYFIQMLLPKYTRNIHNTGGLGWLLLRVEGNIHVFLIFLMEHTQPGFSRHSPWTTEFLGSSPARSWWCKLFAFSPVLQQQVECRKKLSWLEVLLWGRGGQPSVRFQNVQIEIKSLTSAVPSGP